MNKEILLKFISEQGYKRNSPDKNRPMNVIPSNRITMKDVDFPVHGVDNLGNEQVMYPEGEYQFPGDYVIETPMKQTGGLTEDDFAFLNRDFKTWTPDEMEMYQFFKHGNAIPANQEVEDYIVQKRAEEDEATEAFDKEYKSFKEANPDAKWSDFKKYAESKGISTTIDRLIDRDDYERYYGDYHAPFYDLNEKYDLQKFAGLKSRDEYKDYLQSDKYKEIAKKFWGKDADKFTQQQLSDIDNADYRSKREMSWSDTVDFMKGKFAGVHGMYNPITNTMQLIQGDPNAIVPHETSHLTDRNENPLSEDEAYEYKANEYGTMVRYPKNITDEQRKRLEMSSQFSKWQNLEDEFKNQFEKNAVMEHQKGQADYFAKPTEVRARVNTVRNELNKQGVNWKNTEDVKKFINTLPKDDLIRQQYEELDFIDDDLKNTLFNEYAYQDSGTDMLNTAQEGGYSYTQYPEPTRAAKDMEEYLANREAIQTAMDAAELEAIFRAEGETLEDKNAVGEWNRMETELNHSEEDGPWYAGIQELDDYEKIAPIVERLIKSGAKPSGYRTYDNPIKIDEHISIMPFSNGNKNSMRDIFQYTVPDFNYPDEILSPPSTEIEVENSTVEVEKKPVNKDHDLRGTNESGYNPDNPHDSYIGYNKALELKKAGKLPSNDGYWTDRAYYYNPQTFAYKKLEMMEPGQLTTMEVGEEPEMDDSILKIMEGTMHDSKMRPNTDGSDEDFASGNLGDGRGTRSFSKQEYEDYFMGKMQEGGTAKAKAATKEETGPGKPWVGDFLYTKEDIDFLNSSEGREYCPYDGDCLSTALKGYDAIVASKHGDFPSQHAIKKTYGFASANKNDYYSQHGKLYKEGSGKGSEHDQQVSQRTQDWFESKPFFNIKENDFSVDSWDIHGMIVDQGGINIYNQDLDADNVFRWEESNIAKMSDEERAELYSKIPVGAVIGLGGTKTGYGMNGERGLPDSRHSAMVVGHTAEGVPVIYDFGRYTTLDNNKFGWGVSNITFPKEFEGKTKAGLEALNRFDDPPTALSLDLTALQDDADMSELTPFYNTLRDKKVELMNDLNLDNSEYNMLAKLLIAESMQETGGGSATEHDIQSSLGTWFGDTLGLTQMNINNILEDEQLAPIATKYNITDETDLHDPKKAAIASMIYAKRNMSSARNNYETGLFEEGQTGVRSYSPRQSFSNWTRDKFQPGSNIAYDGYTYNTEEGPQVDFVTGNNALRIGWDKDIEDIQSQFEEVSPGRYRVYDTQGEDGNTYRAVDKVTYGNDPNMSEEMKFIYNWQSPKALRTGDAQGGSKHVKQVMDYYNKIVDRKAPGASSKFQQGGTTDGVLDKIYGQYPAMKNMGPVTLKADTSFNKDFTGVGDIEYFAPDVGGRGTTIFPNDNVYAHPDSTLRTHGVVYNPATNDPRDIFLDMLHGMKDSDSDYKMLRENVKNTLLRDYLGDFEADYARDLEKYGEDKMDGREAYIENWVDGKIRNLLFEGSPEDFEAHRYWQGARDFYLSNPQMNQAFTMLHSYLMTNDVPVDPSFTLPEIEITPDKPELLPGEKTLDMNNLEPKYKQGGYTYKTTKQIADAKFLLSLLT